MTRSLRRFARLAIALMLPLLPMLISPPDSHAQAQAGGQTAQELIVHHDGVVNVKDLPPASPGVSVGRVVPRKFPHPELLRRKKEKLEREGSMSQLAPESALPLAPAAGPTIDTSFIGLSKSESGDFIPPDTQVAAGPNHLFEVVNTEGRILNKDGTALTTPPFDGPFSFNTFFGLSDSVFLSDPKIRFDPMSEHWFVLAITLGSSSGAWQLAVSKDSDPTHDFFLYSFTTDNIGPDFPAIGFNDDKVVLTANAFDCNPDCLSSSHFLGAMFLVLKKDDLLAGSTAKFQFFPPDRSLNTIQPAHSLSSTTTLYMAAVKFNKAKKVRIWSVTGVPDGSGGGVTFTTIDLPIIKLSSPPNAVQMGTSVRVETNDNSLLDAVFRDDSLWVAANVACRPSGDKKTRACLRFVEVTNLTGTMTVNQDFNFGTTGTYSYYPAIQTDSANNLITVFSRSSALEFASVYASGRLTSDTPNTLQAPVLIKAGEASYGADRWGDYSGAGIDPSDPTKVWVAGEYALAAGGSEWGTWIAEVHFP
ncbi:MAG: hypothetical protein HY278_00545 [candidate division NC10 bacterium]|nr:hypothetical protein [candidate division NC10 bacterium]